MSTATAVVLAVIYSIIITCAGLWIAQMLHRPRPVMLMPTGPGLPPRLQVLADHGRVIRFVRTRPPLPHRVPGAALVNNPPGVAVEHVITMPSHPLRGLVDQLRARWRSLGTEWILGSPRAFAEDWASLSHTTIRRYVARHRDEGRPRWAELPTAWWPTLATRVDYSEIETNSLLHHCSSEPELYDIVNRTKGSSDADHSGGPGPGGQVHPGGGSGDAAPRPVPVVPGRAASSEPPGGASARRVRDAAAGLPTR